MRDKEGKGNIKILGVITIFEPQRMLDAQGCTSITVDVTPDVTRVAAWIFRDGASFPAEPLPHMRFMDVTSTHVTIDGVGGALAPVGGTSNDNMVVVWSKASAPAWQSKPKATVTFERPGATPPVTVPGTACLFFAYAPPDYHGPVDGEGDGEEEGDIYRPIPLVIPPGATKVTLTANSDMWQHSQNDGDRSNADGLAGGDVTNSAAYKDDAQYNSGGINLLTAKFNRLVGFLEKNFTVPTNSAPVNQIDIGKGPKDIDLSPAGTYSRLFLGMHDSHEWDDNGGAVQVSVTWTF